MENTKRKGVALWRALAIFLLLAQVFVELFSSALYSYFCTPENSEMLSLMIPLLAEVLGILSLACLFPIATNKSLYWALGLWMVPWSIFLIHWVPYIIVTMIYIYIYAMFFINNIHRVSDKYRSWIRVMAIVCVINCTRMLFQGTYCFPQLMDGAKYYEFFIYYPAISYLYIVCKVLYVIAVIYYVMSELYDGTRPQKDEKVDFNPLNKYFIAGVLAVGVGYLLLWLIQYNMYDIDNLL